MNFTELARQLRINPQELRDQLPGFGYDIGQKAIKVNKNVANKIIKDWPRMRRQISLNKEKQEEELKKEKVAVEANKTIVVPKSITVKELASLANIPLNTILSELMKSGIFVSLNERIDYDTAWLVGSELGIEVKKAEIETGTELETENKVRIALRKEKDLSERPPVVVVMGHVDHGKTKLLDAIRESHVALGEAGGITQHIGAYQVEKNNKLTTFIDTPGHEAFTAMRSRGAKIADIAILVVAADDGVKPQTIEAFKIIEAAKIPYVVAINKIDKEGANLDKVKQELSSQLGIVPEDWGGKTVCANVSALKKQGIDELLDMVLLVAETESDKIKANVKALAIGTIIESHVDKGAGPVATMLIQNGTLRVANPLCKDEISIGKVRLLKNYLGENINKAVPSDPVQIFGFKKLPEVGDIIEVGQGEKNKKRHVKGIARVQSTLSSDNQNDNIEIATLNIVIKSDVFGSAEAIEESLEKINTNDVMANIIHKGLGNITEGDIGKAEAADALLLGFNVKLPTNSEELARDKKVEVKLYFVIYDLIDDVKKKMQELIVPSYERVDLGALKVLAIFSKEKNKQILGGKVIAGKIKNGTELEVYRDKELISKGKITSLQSGKQEVRQVEKNQECGCQIEADAEIKENDTLKFYTNKEIIAKL
ncbi:MAG: translation initiation factor IF-2 [Patescibacteria group bacterium]|nr:translation initiation factor IF-2 [Patescibacteria group bacterium]